MKSIKRTIIIINFLLLTALILGFVRQFMDPDHEILFTTSALLFPYITIGLFLTFLFLVVFQSFWAWISLIALILVSGSIIRQIGFHFQSGIPEKSTAYTLGTFNTKDDFTFRSGDQKSAFIKDFEDYPIQILALQEVSQISLLQLKEKMGYVYSSQNPDWDPDPFLGILSQYPIKELQLIRNEHGNIIAMVCDIYLPESPVRLINIHLHSNAVTVRASNFSPESMSRREGLRNFNAMLKAYNDNARARTAESVKIHEAIEASPHPVLLAGDMNDIPFSKVYRNLKKDLQDSFVTAGRGFAQTYDELLIPLKIDYIFADPHFRFFNVSIKKVAYSDHNPMVATFSIIP